MSRICGDAAGMVCDDGGHLAGGGRSLAGPCTAAAAAAAESILFVCVSAAVH